MSRLKISDLLQYRFLAQPRFSPDGKALAFLVFEATADGGGYRADLWLREGETTRRLTGEGDVRSFFWDDEEHLVFAADRDPKATEAKKTGEKLTVYQRISIRSGEAAEYFRIPLLVTQIRPMGGGTFALVALWTPGDPDFGAHREEELAAYKARKMAGMEYEVVEEIPFWMDGGGFLNRSRQRLYLFHRETGALKALTDETTNVTTLDIDGDAVVYDARSFTGRMDMPSGIFRYSESGGEECLLPQKEYMVERVFADGGRVVFSGVKWTNVFDEELTPRLYALKDGQAVPLTDGEHTMGTMPGSDSRLGGGRTVVRRGSDIYYTSAYRTGTRLLRCSFDGRETVLAESPNAIGAFDLLDGQLVYVGSRDDAADELYAGTEGRVLTDFNAWLREKDVVKPEPVTADCGDHTVEGFCMKPAGYEPGKKYPAVLQIHGGPLATYGGAFYHEYQCLANEGYFVFYCNPRGSDGYGRAWASLSGRYGTVDHDDVMAFTDAVLARYPDIDASRVGVAGGSYGGFLTNWIIGHTDRFRAACSQRGISNWISKFGTTDIGYYFNANQIQATPWQNAERMWERSPLRYADRVRTPTLFINGDRDYRCYMTEGMQMFTALRYHGVDARLVLFRGEGHNLSRSGKPRHRIRRIEEIIGWFDKYLK